LSFFPCPASFKIFREIHPLTVEEIDRIDKTVTEDLYHDYSDEEIPFDFDESAVKGCLKVHVQDL